MSYFIFFWALGAVYTAMFIMNDYIASCIAWKRIPTERDLFVGSDKILIPPAMLLFWPALVILLIFDIDP